MALLIGKVTDARLSRKADGKLFLFLLVYLWGFAFLHILVISDMP